MNAPTLNPRALAQAALEIMSKASVQADDASLQAAAGARLMLGAIANGQLMVVPVPQDAPTKPAVDAAVKTAIEGATDGS